MSERLLLIVLVPSPKSRLIDVILRLVMPATVVVNLSGVLADADKAAGVRVADALRWVEVCTATMICAAATRVVPRYALAVTEYVPADVPVKVTDFHGALVVLPNDEIYSIESIVPID